MKCYQNKIKSVINSVIVLKKGFDVEFLHNKKYLKTF